jgi:predicted transcriptional regulator
MLFAMLESPREKRYLREFINPKLLYENLDLLRRMNLIEEVSEQVYGLSKQGEILMQEYLHFLDRIRRSINNFEEEQ